MWVYYLLCSLVRLVKNDIGAQIEMLKEMAAEEKLKHSPMTSEQITEFYSYKAK